MTNMFLDNYTVQDIIEMGYRYKNKEAGRKWTERVLKEKAQREVELEKIAIQEKKNKEYYRFKTQESKPERITRSDEKKLQTCKNISTRYELDLDKLIQIQKDICDEYNAKQNQPEEIDFELEDMGWER